MAFTDTNKAEAHLIPLLKKNRELLKAFLLTKIYPNDQKEITAEMVADVIRSLIDSMPNLLDDNLDLRGYKKESFTPANGQVSFNLQFKPINPEHNMLMFVDGVMQEFGVDYTVNEQTVTFVPTANLWEITADMSVVFLYRYFLVSGTPGTGEEGGSPTTGVNYIEVNLSDVIQSDIEHNLGRLPIGVTIYEYNSTDNVHEVIFPESIKATNVNLNIDFGLPFTGKVLFL